MNSEQIYIKKPEPVAAQQIQAIQITIIVFGQKLQSLLCAAKTA
jgi:hypothetical protein